MALVEITTIQALKRTLDYGPGYDGYIGMFNSVNIDLSEIEKYCKFDKEQFQRILLEGNEDYIIYLTCWMPGQKSAMFSYGNSQCWTYMVEGTLQETSYYKSGLDQEMMEYNKKTIQKGEYSYQNDNVGYVVYENNTDKKSVSLHVEVPGARKYSVWSKSKHVDLELPSTFDNMLEPISGKEDLFRKVADNVSSSEPQVLHLTSDLVVKGNLHGVFTNENNDPIYVKFLNYATFESIKGKTLLKDKIVEQPGFPICKLKSVNGNQDIVDNANCLKDEQVVKDMVGDEIFLSYENGISVNGTLEDYFMDDGLVKILVVKDAEVELLSNKKKYTAYVVPLGLLHE